MLGLQCAWAQELQWEDLVALWHVGTPIPCSERQILNHWTTREVPKVRTLIIALFQNALQRGIPWLSSA